jgi:hypothetical protein
MNLSVKTGFRYLIIASLLATMTTGCKRSDLLDNEETPDKVAPMQDGGQIDCDDANNRAECKTVDDSVIP